MLDTRLLKAKKTYLELTYEALEAKTGIPVRRLKAIFNNKCKRIDFKEIKLLSKALDVPLNEILLED